MSWISGQIISPSGYSLALLWWFEVASLLACNFKLDIDSNICNINPQSYRGRVSALNLLSDTVATLEITLDEGSPELRYRQLILN
ncbi:hypothetical protein [Serratia sp. UGAL515B_01]|uniref:hypothetical protein n=1 Tax=Serratia sp. UGAL515B_01 TaxID=2986763 RepID=UPI002952CFCD|nr:hypothetical protein [Serratia sp. UGAL515B_01]